MIRNLKAKLGALAAKQQDTSREPVELTCLLRDTAAPLTDYPGLLDLMPRHLRLLGEPGAADYFDIRRTLFLDTETTGLMGGAGTLAFLVGLGWVEGDGFVVRQLLMRDYPEEPSVLAELAALFDRFDTVVTFNGKSFDIPLLRSRFTMARMRPQWRELTHIDLIHIARRVWRMRLKDCRLQNIEEQILGMERSDDLPGALVPERYFAFLKCRDMALLEDVLRHNLQDIRTLALLLVRLCHAHAQAEQECFPEDIFSLGRSLERAGETEMARKCYRVASVGTLSQKARLELAMSYRRERDMDGAIQVYREMARRGEGGPMPYEALAMLAERYQKDVSQALWYTERALVMVTEPTLPGRTPDAEKLEALQRRHARLIRRMANRQAHQ